MKQNRPVCHPNLDLLWSLIPPSLSCPAAQPATSKARASNRRCQRIKATAGWFHPQLIFDAVPHLLRRLSHL